MYRPIVDGFLMGALQFTLPQVAEIIAKAHKDGKRWDVRRVTKGAGYRPLTESEAAELIKAVTDRM